MYDLRFLTAVVMKSSVLWDITSCSPLKSIEFSEEHVCSIFRAEEVAKQKTGMMQAVGKAVLAMPTVLANFSTLKMEAFLAACFTLVSCLAYSSTLNMEVA
jgi:hypothetical protein